MDVSEKAKSLASAGNRKSDCPSPSLVYNTYIYVDDDDDDDDDDDNDIITHVYYFTGTDACQRC